MGVTACAFARSNSVFQWIFPASGSVDLGSRKWRRAATRNSASCVIGFASTCQLSDGCPTVAAVYDRRQSSQLATSPAVIFLRLRAVALALRGPPLQTSSGILRGPPLRVAPSGVDQFR